MKSGQPSESKQGALWERIVATITGLVIISFCLYLLFRNEPFKDPNLVILLRTILSLAAGLVGLLIPGFMSIHWKAKGVSVRACGALALAAGTYFWTPRVLPNLDPKLTQFSSQMEKFDADFSVINSEITDKSFSPTDRQEIAMIYEARRALKEKWNNSYKAYASIRHAGGSDTGLKHTEDEMTKAANEIEDLHARLEVFKLQPPATILPRPSSPQGLRIAPMTTESQ